MKHRKECSEDVVLVNGEDANHNTEKVPAGPSRRSFLGTVGGATAVALAAGIPLEPLFEGKHGEAEASVVPYGSSGRTNASWQYRDGTADAEKINVGVLPDNGDYQRYTDYSGMWAKCLKHDGLGVPNAASFLSMYNALKSGNFQDFENIQVGNPGGTNFTATLNGPQAALAFDLEGLDSHATVIPPCPTTASAQTAAEEVEHYWGALCRDVNFTDFPSSSLVAQACADMNKLSYVKSHQNEYPYPLTPQNLFRGQIVPGDGNMQGPFISQFMLQPTFLGAQPLTQQYQRFKSISEGGANYMTSVHEYMNVESGFAPSGVLAFDHSYKFIRMGRDLTAYTHVDALHQAYFVALLVLAGISAPVNPGNPYGYPYGVSRTEHGFETFGSVFGPVDAFATVPEMATRALKAAWFHKWIVNLRMRPEEYGALVQARLTHTTPYPQAAAALNSDVLNSAALPIIYSQYGSYLVPQAFPEGAPGHPCYPTGHGTVGGACIAALKFFFDGSQKIQPLLQAAGSDVMVPSEDGTHLVPYTGSDAGQLTINGELNKLGWNITTGHGIHAGIHFRSSNYYSLLLGEQVGISVLQDRAGSYNEPFTIKITKFDGTTATISNQ